MRARSAGLFGGKIERLQALRQLSEEAVGREERPISSALGVAVKIGPAKLDKARMWTYHCTQHNHDGHRTRPATLRQVYGNTGLYKID